jgi:hypothetical protein
MDELILLAVGIWALCGFTITAIAMYNIKNQIKNNIKKSYDDDPK